MYVETKFEKIMYAVMSILLLGLIFFFAMNSDNNVQADVDEGSNLGSLYSEAAEIDIERANYCAELGYSGGNYKASYACLYKLIGK
ncbi:MAG TPA: hypothetical protein ENI02_02990 [Candidatus Aminicenantes bacterium]|nr:hypothetical protein [Candidatus Aminicenantes bacterium]